MVGGKVINVIIAPSRTWVQCIDETYGANTCAIWVKDAKEMKVGDHVWWQGDKAYWTPMPKSERIDIPLDLSGNGNCPFEFSQHINEAPAWSAAYAFTIEREEAIRQVEDEIELLQDSQSGFQSGPDWDAFERILAREQAALESLKKGMKTQEAQ